MGLARQTKSKQARSLLMPLRVITRGASRHCNQTRQITGMFSERVHTGVRVIA